MCHNIDMNNHYVYIWKEPGVAGSGLPFYVGQGKHKESNGFRSKYKMAHAKHKTRLNGQWVNTPAQDRFDSIMTTGLTPVIEIHSDNITKQEADALEILLIARLGRVIAGTGILLNTTSENDESPSTCKYCKDKVMASAHKQESKVKRVDSFKQWINDPEKSKGWREKVASEEHSAKLSEAIGDAIEYNGVLYPSIRALARHLGTNKTAIRNRIKRGIPLDTPSDAKYVNIPEIEYRGNIYYGYTELSKLLGINKNTLISRIKRGDILDAPVRNRK